MKPLALAIDGTLLRALAYAEGGRVFAFDPSQARDPGGTPTGGQWTAGEYRTIKLGEKVDGREVGDKIPNSSSIDGISNEVERLPGIREVPVAAFDPEYVGPRLGVPPRSYSPSETARLVDLAAAIEESGYITPLIVAIDARGPYVVEGGHRFDALLALGAKSFPAKVVIDVESAGSDPTKWSWKFAAEQKNFTQHDYASLKPRLDALEAASLDALKDALAESRDALVARVRKSSDFAALANDLKRLPRFGAVEMEVRGMLDRARDAGRKDLRREVRDGRRDFADSSFTPKAALRWLRATAFWVAGILGDRVLADVKGIILNGLKTGTAGSVMAEQIFDAFTPWLGDPDVIRDEQQLQPWRLETIVRTNTTTAYNHGRLSEIIDPEIARFVKGIRYSATLDERTTEVCRYLGKMNDGKGALFKSSDPNIEALLPPLHYSCRSLIFAIVAGEKVDASEFITPEEIGKARGLADAKFLTQANAAWKAYSEMDDEATAEKPRPKRKQKKATEFTVAKQADGALKITRTEVSDGEV